MALVWSLLVAPLVVAVVVLRDPQWYPLLDQAVIEMRIRDVWSSDPPLLGIYGRFGPPGQEASHPGPLSFFAIWPLYQLFGAAAWAMQAASASLHAIAIAVALWIGHRRGGVTMALVIAATIAVLTRFYGPFTLTDPWTPYLPMLWWLVFLLAVWSVLCDDLLLLPVVVLTGSFCTQAHAGYAGLTVGLGGLALAVAAVTAFRRRRNRADSLIRLVRWTAVSAVVSVLVWAPPLFEEISGQPGNLAKLRDYFSNSPEAPIGARGGAKLLLSHLDPTALVIGQLGPSDLVDIGSPLPGLVMLVVWAVSVAMAWQLGLSALSRLHLAVGAALLLALVTMSRIFGALWNYLVPWAWSILVLMVVAVGWTFGAWAAARTPLPADRRTALGLRLTMLGVAGLASAAFGVDALRAEISRPDLSAIMDQIVPATADALADGSGPGGGRSGRYLVTWSDPAHLGTQGYGLLNELERRRFHVGAEPLYGAPVRPRRVLDRDAASAVVVLATGVRVEEWRAQPGMKEVIYVDLRSPAERAEYDRLRSTSKEDLRAADRPELADVLDTNPWGVRFHPDASQRVRDAIVRMTDIGVPTAVFVGPPEAATLH